MTMTTTYSTLAPTLPVGSANPLFDMFAKINSVYTDTMQADASQLFMSSTRIIQEHTLQAMMNASQDCMAALTQNAASIQQQSMAHLGCANQKAVEIMMGAMTKAMAGGFKPVM
jgi:nitrogen-specific signal transduction histidine kinase